MPDGPPLSLALQVGPSQEPGYICMGYTWTYEDRMIDCTPAVWPLPIARQIRMLMSGFLEDVAGPHCTHAAWELGDVIIYHSKLSGFTVQLQKVGRVMRDIEEFLGPIAECITEIDATHPWSSNQPIEWLQRFLEN